ncbi:MAG: hypothetical protein EU549_02605 [Promethearchaeota archaeon]|nr:MAG: hypothetical protein EU549_02605 [Candidatus Lokiarchaeota archaeon]
MKKSKIIIIWILFMISMEIFLITLPHISNKKIINSGTMIKGSDIQNSDLEMETLHYSWIKTWGGSNTDEDSSDISLDGDGNIYIVGITESFGSGEKDIFLLKYDRQGNLLWNITWGGSNNEWVYEIALDSENNIYMVGSTESFSQNYSDGFLLKFDNSGVPQWNNIWDVNNSAISLYSLVIDNSNNVYVSGSEYNYTSLDYDVFLSKISKDGDIIFNKTWGSTNRELAQEWIWIRKAIYIL